MAVNSYHVVTRVSFVPISSTGNPCYIYSFFMSHSVATVGFLLNGVVVCSSPSCCRQFCLYWCQLCLVWFSSSDRLYDLFYQCLFAIMILQYYLFTPIHFYINANSTSSSVHFCGFSLSFLCCLALDTLFCTNSSTQILTFTNQSVSASQPCQVLYTTMFWLTLRQYVQEVVEVTKREMSSAAALQPFTVAVSTTSSGQPVTTLISSHGTIQTALFFPFPLVYIYGQEEKGSYMPTEIHNVIISQTMIAVVVFDFRA